jgi:hypothetical protein
MVNERSIRAAFILRGYSGTIEAIRTENWAKASYGEEDMKQVLTKALLAAVIGISGLSAAPVAALADGIYFGFDTGPGDRRGPPPPPDRFGPPGARERFDRRPPPPPPGYGCSEREALRRAWRMGFDKPEIVRVTPRRVIVEGGYGRRLRQIEFANVPGCPPL